MANVSGDNEGVGAAVAAYFVSLGLQPGDEVVVFEGDTSSVATFRNDGFKAYLTGEKDYNGEFIADDAKWTVTQLLPSAMNWSRSTAKEYFETLMSDPNNASIKWFYSQDDEFALGIWKCWKAPPSTTPPSRPSWTTRSLSPLPAAPKRCIPCSAAKTRPTWPPTSADWPWLPTAPR